MFWHGHRVRHGRHPLAAALRQLRARSHHGGCWLITDRDGSGQRSRDALSAGQVGWRGTTTEGWKLTHKWTWLQQWEEKFSYTWSNVSKRFQPVGGHLRVYKTKLGPSHQIQMQTLPASPTSPAGEEVSPRLSPSVPVDSVCGLT